MSFYIRKSISVGPFRFSLSKSGIGVSAGIRGLHFGTGPHGNYIHMGKNGLHYRKTISSPSPKLPNSTNSLNEAPTPVIPSGTHAPMQEIESAEISQIVDSSSIDLLDELNRKRKVVRIWPSVMILFALVLGIGLVAAWPNWLLALIILSGGFGIYVAHNRDVIKKTVVLFYRFDSEMESAYAKLITSAEQLARCAAAWHIEAEGKVHDRKYHAGASSLIQRKFIKIRKVAPPYVKTNIETIEMNVGRQTLHFLPDRLLVYDINGVGAVGYKELQVHIRNTRFIEDGNLPDDAKIVDKTWAYVNKNGGPDRRFKNNKELPICLYEEISLRSETGLNEMLHVSQCGVGKNFADAIDVLGKLIAR